jgi:lysophospholipase L1-like esterase
MRTLILLISMVATLQAAQAAEPSDALYQAGVQSTSHASASPAPSEWVASWQTSPLALLEPTDPAAHPIRPVPQPTVAEGTLRYRIRPALAGSAVRLRLTNEFRDKSLRISSVSIARARPQDSSASPSIRVTFGSQFAITIPPGAPAVSDSIALPTRPFEELIVSIYVPEGVALAQNGQVDTWLARGVDATTDGSDSQFARVEGRPIVSGLDVLSDANPNVIVTLGDSITDGTKATPAIGRGWPEVLARRLASRAKGRATSVVNAGISGNQLLQALRGPAALARFDRDVLAAPGVTHVICLLGTNDILASGWGPSPVISAAEVVAGYNQLIFRAQAHGIVPIGATLPPFGDSPVYSDAREKVRLAVNAWIRQSGAFAHVIDFDQAVRDSAHPDRLRATLDSGDHIHPNDAGYVAMADAIDLTPFE